MRSECAKASMFKSFNLLSFSGLVPIFNMKLFVYKLSSSILIKCHKAGEICIYLNL